MEILSPKELVGKVTGETKEKTKSVFRLKSKSTINGMFFGGGCGFLVANYTNKNKWIGTIAGIIAGGLISNILTVEK